MAINLLSAALCKNAGSEGAAIRKLPDGDGLYFWVYQDGRKYWRMRYWQSGKEKSLSLGVYPQVSLSSARKKRDEVRKQLEANLDPSAERKAANLRRKLISENSFQAVAMEWYAKQIHTWVTDMMVCHQILLLAVCLNCRYLMVGYWWRRVRCVLPWDFIAIAVQSLPR